MQHSHNFDNFKQYTRYLITIYNGINSAFELDNSDCVESIAHMIYVFSKAHATLG